MPYPQSPPFKQIEDGKSVPQCVDNVKKERNQNDADALRDVLGLNTVIIIGGFNGFSVNKINYLSSLEFFVSI